MASFPTSVKTFVSKVDGVDTVAAADVNDPCGEITAIEGDLLNGMAHDLLPDGDTTRKLGSAVKRWDGSNLTSLPAANLTGTLPAISGANLTNLPAANVSGSLGVVRITPRVTTITSSATPTVNTDNCDVVNITALAAAITSMSSGLTGTPHVADKLLVRIQSDSAAHAITWGASFAAKGVALPTTTVASKLLTVGFVADSAAIWGCVASVQET